MTKRERSSGIKIIIVAAVIIVGGVVGWLGYANLSAPKSPTETSQAKDSQQVTVEKESDLYEVEKALDGTPVKDSDSASLEEAIGKF